MANTVDNTRSRSRRTFGFVTGVMLIGTANALVHNSVPLKSRHHVSSSALSVTMSAVQDEKKTKFRPNPVVVSAEAEALSHSDTTMKLTPSYDLFQMLTVEEGGEIPKITGGNAMRDPTVLKGTGNVICTNFTGHLGSLAEPATLSGEEIFEDFEACDWDGCF